MQYTGGWQENVSYGLVASSFIRSCLLSVLLGFVTNSFIRSCLLSVLFLSRCIDDRIHETILLSECCLEINIECARMQCFYFRFICCGGSRAAARFPMCVHKRRDCTVYCTSAIFRACGGGEVPYDSYVAVRSLSTTEEAM